MVTKKVSVTLCDECQEDRPTLRYYITSPAGRAKLDLCDEHATPLRDLMDLVQPRPTKPRARTRSAEPVTMKEVRRARRQKQKQT